MRRWHVVQSKPHQEGRVESQLRDRGGFTVYYPQIQVVAVRRGHRVKEVRPLFPNYVFALLDLPAEWKLVTYTPGVARILGGWEDPKAIDEAVITTIRSQESRRDRLIHYYRFKPEERVQIRSGPMRDLYGIFDRYVDEKGRVRVLLSMVGFQASVELEADQLARA